MKIIMVSWLLIIGGVGFIGFNFIYYWCEIYFNYWVVVLDVLIYVGNKEILIDL